MIDLFKAHKANPRVHRIVENGSLHETRPDTSLALDTVSDGPKELDNNESGGSITPTQASFDKSQARKANSSLTNSKARLVVECVIVDRRGGKESLF